MKNFQCLGSGINVAPLLNAILRCSTWNTETLRTTAPGSPHTEVDDIWLRFNELGDDPASVIDDHESINYPAWFKLPDAQAMCLDLMRQVRGERLGRVLITRLAPGKTIAPHIDGGSHAKYYDRYHIVLQGLPGSLFRCGEETVCMRTGEAWWFQNSVEHEIINNSADDRIHLIVDIRTCR